MDVTVEAVALAQLFGLTPTRISQLGKNGTLPKAKARGKYLLLPSVKNYIAMLRNQRLDASQSCSNISEEILQARLRKLKAEAAAKEHALMVEEGRYVTNESQEREGLEAGQIIKQLVLKIPSDLPQILVGLDYPDAVKKCEDYAYDMLNEMTNIYKS